MKDHKLPFTTHDGVHIRSKEQSVYWLRVHFDVDVETSEKIGDYNIYGWEGVRAETSGYLWFSNLHSLLIYRKELLNSLEHPVSSKEAVNRKILLIL